MSEVMSVKWDKVDLKTKKALGSQTVDCLLNMNKIIKRELQALLNNFFLFLFSPAA
jgi:hypothetical protein